MSFNYWHFISLVVIIAIFVLGIKKALNQEKKKLVIPMIFSVSLVTLLLLVFSIMIVDKYTKVVKVYKVKNKRILSIEKIVYTGIVKNEGNHNIAKVTLEIKLVNMGHATGNVKGGSFFKSTGFFNLFTDGLGMSSKPQTVTKEFIVAKNLKPGTAKSFRVYFDYPPYFRHVSQFIKVWGH